MILVDQSESNILLAIVLGFVICLLYLLKQWLDKSAKRSSIFRRLSVMDLHKQSLTIPGPERIRYSIFAESETKFMERWNDNVATLYDNFLQGLKDSQDGRCLGHRGNDPRQKYTWLKYSEVLQKATKFGAGLVDLGLNPGENTFVGIYSQNRAEWDIAALACITQSMVIIPLYDSLGHDSAAFIINQAEIEVVICDNVTKLKKLLEYADTMPTLKCVIVMDWHQEDQQDIDNGRTATSSTHHVTVVSFHLVESAGEKRPVPLNLPNHDSVYIICYTSGTTGNPKGVMISHGSLICQLASFKTCFEALGLFFRSNDCAISYLPLAHMFEQMVHHLCFSYGARIGYFRGSVSKLLEDIKELKPTFLPVVPRLLNKLYDGVNGKMKTSNVFVQSLYKLALYFKLKEIRTGLVRKNSIWDYVVFRKIQKQLGGEVRLIVTGSAPIMPEVKEFSWAVLGSLIMEAYGQTEVTAGVTTTFPTDTTVGHVGGVMPCCLVKLVDVPELEYYANDDVGEICVKGPCVTKGYFKEPEKTAELIDSDGWLHTGDVGRWLLNGTLKVVDRRKHILKLSQGEYIAPEKIENIYLRCPLISQIYVDGNSFQPYLVAIVVPDREALSRLVYDSDQPVHNQDFAMLCQRADVLQEVLKALQETGKRNGLNSIEQVKGIHLSPEPFTLENGLLTPTMKSKRPQLKKNYETIMQDLYAKTKI